MVKILPSEKWQEVKISKRKNIRKRYAISNQGRVVSYTTEIKEGTLLSQVSDSHLRLRVKVNGVLKNLSVSRLVAKYFLEKPATNEKFVIHKDGNSQNNHYKNLQWVSKAAMYGFINRNTSAAEQQVKIAGEKWVVLALPETKKLQNSYAISNKGRLKSFTENIQKGNILKTALHKAGYPIWRFKSASGYHAFLIHRLVASNFCKQASINHSFVIHLDRNNGNNEASNLKWVTLAEQRKFASEGPAAKAAIKALHETNLKRGITYKLNEAKVQKIKTALNSTTKKVTQQQLATKYNVSIMQISRIKSGENWAWVK